MKNRKHLYISNKNVLTWLMVLCMACSVAARILFPFEKGIGVWDQKVLPIAAALLFALIALISGKERYFKTAIPVWLYAIYYCFIFCSFQYGAMDTLIKILFVIALVSIAIAYTVTIANRAQLFWSMIPALLLPLCGLLYLFYGELKQDFKPFLADILLSAGMVLPLLAVKFHTDGKYHPTWGDRVDGRRVRTLPAMAQVSPYIMVRRNESSNFYAEAIEITQVERYIRQKRKEGLTNFGLIHVLLAAYCRTLCKYPALNRFLAGQRVYQRGEDVQFCMVIKKEMSSDSPDTAIKIHLKPTDTATEIYHKMNKEVEKVKNTPLNSNFDHTAALFTLLPGVLLKFFVWLLKLLDYFGLLPNFLMEISPFHGSVFFTSMGSLGIQPIYHHLYDFGNLPVFGAFGCKRRVTEVQEDGTLVQRKYVDCKFVLDERIVDGFYYAAFFKNYKRLLARPDILDLVPDEVLCDID